MEKLNPRRKAQKAVRRASMRGLAASGLLLMAAGLTSCDKDVLTGQPEWLGNSIYERLEEGIDVEGTHQTFGYTLRLIDDLGQSEVLAHTGSRTLFVASDAAFDAWFSTNDWGVRSYDQLSLAQKKMLLNNAMITNAYLLELMSNVSGDPPQGGLCMRRASSASIHDTVFTMTPDEMPAENPLGRERLDAWASFRSDGKAIKIFKDNTSAPMIHFLPEFMRKNDITGDDLYRLTNGVSSSTADSWINGRKVISDVQTCKNGYIYVVDGVVEASRNMAEIINGDERMSLWAAMLNRFAAPFYDRNGSIEYNRLNGTTGDSVYVLRYYSDWSVDGLLSRTPQDYAVPARLAFDPGWNQYMYRNTMGYDMHYDAGAMIVPTDEALLAWWNGAGKSLQNEYGTLENIPALTLSKLLRVNMLPSFVDAVPSKFGNIVDDSKVPIGIRPDNIVESFMGCNGVVYLVNQVFSPSEYRSVVYPALASESLMGVIYYAIDNYDFGPFLNSMESTFSLILPYNVSPSYDAGAEDLQCLHYLDPCTYGLPQQIMLEFYFDEEDQKVKAHRYLCQVDAATGDISGIEKIADASDAVIKNRLSDLVDNLIIVGDLTPAQHYYKTKAGSIIYVDYKGTDDVTMAGGYQLQTGERLTVDDVYDMKQGGGNGFSYGFRDRVPQTAAQSVYEVLRADTAYQMFYDLMSEDETGDAFFVSQQGTSTNYYCANDESNRNIRLFENYNYTVYVPTNAAIRALVDKGMLPTWDTYKQYEGQDDAQAVIAKRIQDFVRYHLQDNSVYIGGEAMADTARYESSMLNPANKRFYSLAVKATADGISVTDQLGNERHVVTTGGRYNIPCREYWMTKSGATVRTQTRQLSSSSNVVVHQIDGVLLYSDEQLAPWYTVNSQP